MTQEIIKNNLNESVENKDVQQVEQVEQVKPPTVLNEYDKLEQKLEQKLSNYDSLFIKEFLRDVRSIIPLIVVGKNEQKRTSLTKKETANLLEYANFGIDISPKAGMLYYFSRGDQFGFLTPRAIIEMLAKIGVSATVQVICSNDQFKVDPANLQIKHILALPRGETLGVYAILRQNGTIIAIEVMEMIELIKIQKIANAHRESQVWKTHFEEMAKKTILKRIAKRTPILDHNTKQALAIDSKGYSQPEPAEKINNVAVTTQPERV